MIFPQNVTEIQSFRKHQVVSIDVYGLASSDFVFLTIDTVPGAFLLSVGLIRSTRIRTVFPGGVQIYLFPIVNIDVLKDPLSDFIFLATLGSTQNYTGAAQPVIFDQVAGNVSGNYDNVTGIYTFDAGADGTFNFQGQVIDNVGSGSTTMILTSDIQGILDSQLIPNNNTANVALTFTGSFLINEEVSISVVPGDTDIIAGAMFEFQP